MQSTLPTRYRGLGGYVRGQRGILQVNTVDAVFTQTADERPFYWPLIYGCGTPRGTVIYLATALCTITVH